LHADLLKTDRAAMECIDPERSGQDRDNWVWIREAEKKRLVVGTQARILYQDAEGRLKIALRFSEMVRNGEIGPVMLGRDHHDVSGADSPFRETANIKDGSNIMADMSVQCFAGNAARGMSLVALHNGGGVGIGKTINGGFVNSDITLFIGGGKKYFADRSDKVDLFKQLKDKGFKVAFDMNDVKQTTSGKLAALIADEHPATYPERGEFLPESVQTALDILDNNSKGFFLIVEGSQIDWESHDNNAEGVVNEMIDFDRTIKVAFDYADKNPGTLVVITADHETGGMALTGGSFETGEVKAAWGSTGHTSVMVPVFSYGTGAEKFAGIYENIDIYNKIMSLYGFKK
jgi:hypothetical protein